MSRVGNVVVVVLGEAKEWEKRTPRGWARAELFNVWLRPGVDVDTMYGGTG